MPTGRARRRLCNSYTRRRPYSRYAEDSKIPLYLVAITLGYANRAVTHEDARIAVTSEDIYTVVTLEHTHIAVTLEATLTSVDIENTLRADSLEDARIPVTLTHLLEDQRKDDLPVLGAIHPFPLRQADEVRPHQQA